MVIITRKYFTKLVTTLSIAFVTYTAVAAEHYAPIATMSELPPAMPKSLIAKLDAESTQQKVKQPEAVITQTLKTPAKQQTQVAQPKEVVTKSFSAAVKTSPSNAQSHAKKKIASREIATQLQKHLQPTQSPQQTAEVAAKPLKVKKVVVANGGDAVTVPAPAPMPKKVVSQAPAKKEHLVSLNFQSIETKTLLQMLAKTSGLNFIISDNVKGSMTLHVTNVAWQQALDIILKANGLDYRRFGKVMLIAPIQELATNEINELQARQKVAQLAPLESEIIRLNYANAHEIANILKGDSGAVLSARGQVGVDSRTNSLWIRDLREHIDEIKHFVSILDIPAKQVLIEAKIVSVEKGFTRDIGVRFGVSREGRLSHKLLKADGTTSFGDATSAVNDRLFFNLPSGFGDSAASVALSLLRLGSKNFLDLELSALEEEGHAETISSPRLITSNQKEASIEQGEEIPYLTASSSGSTSIEFKKAVLSLKITPQITPDRNIILQLRVTQDTRGEQIKINEEKNSLLLPPAINTKEVESNVFLKNGQTIVIGGIYKRSEGDTVRRVPFLGKLPIIGHLFRQKVHDNAQSELLVFITPRIIERGYMGPRKGFHDGLRKCCTEGSA